MGAYRFPAVANIKDIQAFEQMDKVNEEVAEANDAYITESNERFVEELLDVIHAIETEIRIVMPDPEKVEEARQRVIEKNARRGYYGVSK